MSGGSLRLGSTGTGDRECRPGGTGPAGSLGKGDLAFPGLSHSPRLQQRRDGSGEQLHVGTAGAAALALLRRLASEELLGAL